MTRAHDIKQVLVIRDDTGMNAGKVGAQVSHACVGAFLPRETTRLVPMPDGNYRLEATISAEAAAWYQQLSVKIVARVPSEEALLAIYEEAKAAGLPCVLIQDAGFTHFDGVPTHTAVGIGPASSERIDKVTRKLPLLRDLKPRSQG